MKVGLVVPTIKTSRDGTFSGGHAHAALDLGDWLAGRGHVVRAWIGVPRRFRDAAASLSSAAEIELVPVGARPGTRRYALEFGLRLTSRLRSAGADGSLHVLHLHAGHGGYAALAPAARLAGRAPVVVSIYCPVAPPEGLGRRAERLATALGLRGAARVVAVSRHVEVGLLALGTPRGRLARVGPPVDTETFVPGRRREPEPGAAGAFPRILYVGNVHPEKGLDVLLEAAAGILAEFPEARLTVVLDGDRQRDDLLSGGGDHPVAASLADLPDAIDWRGWVPDMAGLMAESDVLVAPFRSTDGPADYPVTVLEAMASGCAVVASRVGGIPELLDGGDHGVLVEPGDTRSLQEGLREATRRIRQDPSIREQARELVVERFSPPVVGRAMEAVYADVTGTGGRAPHSAGASRYTSPPEERT